MRANSRATLLALAVYSCLCLAAVEVSGQSSPMIVDLNGDDWGLVNGNGTVSIAATVPGVTHMDLMRAGILGDPYYRFNEIEPLYRDVVYDQWTYSKTFSIDPAVLTFAQTDLVFDGLDTSARITLNGHPVGVVNNMFRRWTFDVTNFLVGNNNVLVVAFDSPIDYGKSLYQQYPYTVSISDPVQNLPYRNFVRKSQSDYGWDWGPAFTPTGIFRSVRLVAFNSAYITDVTATQTYPNAPDLTTAIVNVTAYLRFVTDPSDEPVLNGVLNVSLSGATGSLSLDSTQAAALVYDGTSPFSLLLTVSNPTLWWPVGYGTAALSPLIVGWQCAENGESDTATQQFGFRRVEVVREPGPGAQQGMSFFFRINNLPIFAKGANFIPMDAFHPRVGLSNFTRLLQNAAEANINIVRVWGGGVYQQHEFYDLADQMGLMVWQEFAFACAMYPRDTAFLNNVRFEVHYQVRRLATHPSVVIFGGNNENEAALHWYPEPIANRDLYLIDYVKLYLDTVRDSLLQVIGMNTEFVSSSPSNGPLNPVTTIEDPYVQMWGDPQDIRYGDVHFYDYGDDCSNVTIYPRARFVSEFGFQSHSSFISYSAISEPQDWAPDSELFQFRQRHPEGNAELLAQMLRHFRLPTNSSAQQSFDDYIYLTQAVQSICYGSALQYWRSIKQETPGNTMGIIYWQLNDIWQGPTWSSTEYGGRWKMVHYRVKRAFAPLIVAPYWADNSNSELRVYVVSDMPTTTLGAGTVLQIDLYSWSGTSVSNPLTSVQYPFTLNPLQSSLVFDKQINTLTGSYCTDYKTCFLYCRVVNTNTGQELAATEFYLTPIAQVALPQATISITNVTQVSATHASVSLISTAFAPYTWVETATIAGHFSDNGFLAPANTSVTLDFWGDAPFNVADLAASLRVRSIVDTYSAASARAIPDGSIEAILAI